MIFTSIEISASPESVRKVFFDFKEYPTWHTTFIKSITPIPPSTDSAELTPGQKVHGVFVDLPEFDATITKNDETCVQWRGPPIATISGLHTFAFTASETTPGGTTFVQKEEFEGVLSFLMQDWLVGRSLKAGFIGFNEDLKKRVESLGG